MSRGPVSVQLYSIREAMSQDLDDALGRLAGTGFVRVEPFGFIGLPDRPAPFEVARLRAALDAAGLTATSGHAPVLQLEDTDAVFDAAAQLGIETLVDPFHDPDSWSDADAVARTADRINRVAADAAVAGLTFGYHNHWFELESQIDGQPALERLAGLLDPAVVLEVDTYWAEVGGVSAPDLLRRLGDRVTHIHVKDGPKTRDVKAQVAAGRGEMDVQAVLAAAPDAVRVIEFDDTTGDVFEGLAASLAFVVAADAEAEA